MVHCGSADEAPNLKRAALTLRRHCGRGCGGVSNGETLPSTFKALTNIRMRILYNDSKTIRPEIEAMFGGKDSEQGVTTDA
jgi:hypothetical protein